MLARSLRTAFVLVAFIAAFAGADSGGIARKVLTWADFVGTPDADSPYDAYTYWMVSYSYSWKRGSDGYAIVDLSVRNWLDEKSWVKYPLPKNHKQLLAHEQRHYDFSVLTALEFKRLVTASKFHPSEVDAEIERLFDDTLAFYVDLELAYDEETNHGLDRDGQRRWDEWFDSEIARLWRHR
jgi:hypothetical protein